MKKLVLLALGFCAALSSCTTLKSAASQAAAMKNCTYTYHSISNVAVGDIQKSDALSLLALPKLMNLIGNAAETLPVSMTLNIEVQNPNAIRAGFEGLEYQLALDSIELTQGTLSTPFYVEPQTSATLPIDMKIDLRQLLTANNATALTRLAANLLGLGSSPSNLTVRLKPTLKLLHSEFTPRNFIPIDIAVGANP